MIIEFHLAGENRKKLAWAIATIIGTTAEYQYMPTCAYQIGECYTVTKSGDLEISDQADRKETERLLAELASRGYVVPDTSEPESKGLTVQMPSDFFTEHTRAISGRSAKTRLPFFRLLFKPIRWTSFPRMKRWNFRGLQSNRTAMQMPTAPSFPCSANLQRTRAASTASRTPPTIPSTPCGVS